MVETPAIILCRWAWRESGGNATAPAQLQNSRFSRARGCAYLNLGLGAAEADQVERNRVCRGCSGCQRRAQLVTRKHGQPLPPVGSGYQEIDPAMTADHVASVELIDRRGSGAEAERLHRRIDALLNAAALALRAHQRL